MTVSLIEAVEADEAWMTAYWANGAALVKWLREIGAYDGLVQSRQNLKLFDDWRAGGKAQFYAVDRVLVEAGSHPAFVPPEIWLTSRNGNGKRNGKVAA